MFPVEEKIEMFFKKELWEKAVQHCIDKGIKPYELSTFILPEFRAKLAEDMLNGKYRVAPPRIVAIPKDVPGEFREINVNTVLDRLVLTLINEVYSTLYKDRIHPQCVSYQKGIGVKKIVEGISHEIVALDNRKHGELLGYKIDISKYFDSVSREVMNVALKSVDTGSCLDEILYEYYNDDVVMNAEGRIEKRYKSLCQGCAPSAFFANIILREVDDVMAPMCRVYYRYSDDILMICDDPEMGLKKLKEALSEKGLKCNPKKIKPIYVDTWFDFLGCEIRGENITLSKKSLDNFVKEIRSRVNIPKGKRECSDSELRRSIRKVNNYLYTTRMKDPSKFCWADYFFGIINCDDDIVALDTWLKDMLRGVRTGKCNGKDIGGLGFATTEGNRVVMRGKGRKVRSNMEKVDLEEYGYVSMHHLYKVSKINREVYRSELYRL